MVLLIVGAIMVGLALLSGTRPPTTAGGSGSPDATTGWFDFSGATIQRVPSGDTSAKYASGVTASTGSFFVRLRKDPTPDSCTLGQSTAPIYNGPYTNWGDGHSPTFPPGGFTTAVDIYLDVDYAIANPDARFDWSSAISDTSGNNLRDFAFNVGTDATGFVMTTGTTATRCASNPADPAPGHSPVIHIARSGWYTFKHIFGGVAGAPLTVTQTVASATSPDIPLGTWTHSDPSDRIGAPVGGINEGSFVQNEFDGLAIDNATVGAVGDLSVQTTDSPDPARVGRTLTYTVQVTNLGPATATDVAIVNTLPDGTGFGSVTTKNGTCTRSNLVITCNVGTIASGDTTTLTIVFKPSRTGPITNTATVSAASFTDLNTANDTAAQSTTVLP
jgi:conserved repeat domain